MEPLSPYALGSLDDLLRHLGLDGSSTEGARDRAVMAGNRAVGYMERTTGRALRVRTHRNPVNIVGTWTTTAVISSIADTSVVKVHDDIVGVGLEIGSRVLSIDSATQITLDRIPTATGTGVTLTCGSRPLVVDGLAVAELWIPETPVHAVYGVDFVESDGSLTAADLTGASLERDTGFYKIPSDVAPRGDHNVQIECLAGYVPPSATDRGDWSDWENLKGIWLRAAEVYFQEKTRHAGRIASQNLGATSLDYRPDMPQDIRDDLDLYLRRP